VDAAHGAEAHDAAQDGRAAEAELAGFQHDLLVDRTAVVEVGLADENRSSTPSSGRVMSHLQQ
jgi:hypothetical protein